MPVLCPGGLDLQIADKAKPNAQQDQVNQIEFKPLDKTATDKILNGSANGNAADLESPNEDVLGRQLVPDLQDSD
jgi:hypothetical protein